MCKKGRTGQPELEEFKEISKSQKAGSAAFEGEYPRSSTARVAPPDAPRTNVRILTLAQRASADRRFEPATPAKVRFARYR